MSEQSICPFCLSGIEPGQQECPFCGASLQNRNPGGCLPLGAQLDGRYTIGSYLAVDGEGVLYKAVEHETRTFVVIKEYMPVTLCASRAADGRICPKEGSEVLFKTTRMDFADLYRALQKLGRRPGLAWVKDVVERNDSVYAVMESLDGISLADYLQKRGQPLSVTEAANLLLPVLQAVAMLHQQGVVHYGICPRNIRITSGGEARLEGFGTQGLRTAGGELKSQLYEGYSAPEQYSAAEFTGRFTDVYGAAAVLYRAVTGTEPMAAGERRISDTMPAARAVNDSVPAYISGVLQAAMQLQPSQRLQNMDELVSALTSPAPEQPEQPKDTGGKKVPVALIAGIAGGVILLALLGAFLLLPSSEPAPSSSSSSQSQSVSSQPGQVVPNFVGMRYSDVYQNDTYVSRYMFRVEEAYSDSYEKGVVMDQRPQAGEQLSADSELVTLVVSKGPENIKVPSVIGKQRTDAEMELQSAGFSSIQVIEVDNNGEYAVGCVVSVMPGEGSSVAPTTTITIEVAKDLPVATPTPSPSPTATPVPESSQPESSSQPEAGGESSAAQP